MKFDSDSDFQKHRDAFGKVSYTQNGHNFTAGFKDLGKVNGVSDPEKKKQKKKDKKRLKEIRQRASEKLADFSGEAPSSPIAEALAENKAAKEAEEE